MIEARQTAGYSWLGWLRRPWIGLGMALLAAALVMALWDSRITVRRETIVIPAGGSANYLDANWRLASLTTADVLTDTGDHPLYPLDNAIFVVARVKVSPGVTDQFCSAYLLGNGREWLRDSRAFASSAESSACPAKGLSEVVFQIPRSTLTEIKGLRVIFSGEAQLEFAGQVS